MMIYGVLSFRTNYRGIYVRKSLLRIDNMIAKYKKKLDRFKRQLAYISEHHEKYGTLRLTYYGGRDYGYALSRVSEVENMIDDLESLRNEISGEDHVQ